jgi:hypothetical protein
MKIESGQPFHLEPSKKRPQGANATGDAPAAAAENPSTVLNLSDGIRQIQEKMKDLKSNEEPRQDLVADAKNELAEWKGLSDDKIDSILNKMVDEMNL